MTLAWRLVCSQVLEGDGATEESQCQPCLSEKGGTR
jgi:hypothetical protein